MVGLLANRFAKIIAKIVLAGVGAGDVSINDIYDAAIYCMAPGNLSKHLSLIINEQ